MAITPSTNLKILKCPLELDNENQLNFNNVQTQFNYFNTLPSLEIDNISYQRKDNIIRYPAHIDSILEYNYCMYQNENYSNKWFYAFITNMRYVSDSMTEITIKTDVFQTWQFDLVYKKSFIEREHVNDDTIGLHTVPENLETGEYICVNYSDFGFNNKSCHFVVALSEDPFRGNTNYPYQVINGIPTGLHYFVVGDFTSVNFIGYITNYVQQKADPSIIQSIFIVPDDLTGYVNSSSSSYWKFALQEGGQNFAPYHKLDERTTGAITLKSNQISKNYSNINNYIPKNNKLFTFPYNYLMIDNNNGTAHEYRYEDFSYSSCEFKTIGSITPGCSIRTYPRNYKGVTDNNSEGINAGKLPIGSWSTDTYTNWLTQNGVNVTTGIAAKFLEKQGAAEIAAPILLGGSIIDRYSHVPLLSSISSTLSETYKHSFIPAQVGGNINAGDVTYSNGKNWFTYYKRCIKKEYAEIIDNYFTMYGYKVNILKIPNINSRQNFNYVKTIGCNIEANIPQEDLQEIKSLFNNGLTIWHNTSTFLNYDTQNNIIGG